VDNESIFAAHVELSSARLNLYARSALKRTRNIGRSINLAQLRSCMKMQGPRTLMMHSRNYMAVHNVRTVSTNSIKHIRRLQPAAGQTNVTKGLRKAKYTPMPTCTSSLFSLRSLWNFYEEWPIKGVIATSCRKSRNSIRIQYRISAICVVNVSLLFRLMRQFCSS
jgi:hypothetical protein